MKQIININQYPPRIQQLIEERDIDELANLIMEKNLKVTKELLNFSDDCGETVKQRIKRKQREELLSFFSDLNRYGTFFYHFFIWLFAGFFMIGLSAGAIALLCVFLKWAICWVISVRFTF